MKIAILDDDPVQLEFVSDVVRDAGYRATLFSRGQALISALRKDTFDMLIVDWNLPDRSGLEVLAWARTEAPSYGADAGTLVVAGGSAGTTTWAGGAADAGFSAPDVRAGKGSSSCSMSWPTRSTGTFHSKASSRPVTGENGAQLSDTWPSATHAGSRGARTALASQ